MECDPTNNYSLFFRPILFYLQLDGNELYYDGHVNLITVLRELMELEEARKAREKMSEVYPLTPGMRDIYN